MNDDILRRRAARYARLAESETVASHEVVVFRRGEAAYAIAHGGLREIRPLRRFCRVPGASAVVPGAFHFRGEIVSLHDLGAFGRAGAAPAFAPWVVLAEHAESRLGLLADEVLGIEALTESEIRALPLTMGPQADLLRGIARNEVLLLDPAALFSVAAFYSAF